MINLFPVEITKGTAITALAQERSLRGIVYLGDDVTDLDAFRPWPACVPMVLKHWALQFRIRRRRPRSSSEQTPFSGV